MEELGVAKPGHCFETRPEMIDSADIWGRVLQIFFATVFSVALVWIVIRIWNSDEDEPGKTPEEKEK